MRIIVFSGARTCAGAKRCIASLTSWITAIGGSFQVNSFTDTENLWTAGVDFLYRAKSGFFVGVDYQGEFGSGYFSNEAQFKAGWAF